MNRMIFFRKPFILLLLVLLLPACGTREGLAPVVDARLSMKPDRAPRPVPVFVPRVRLSPKPRPAVRDAGTVSGGWIWPATGRVVATFSLAQGRKGIDIAGKKGEKIRAVSGGVVAYAGNGIERYGNLIMIKHNQQCLTAYGNNMRNLVHEGQHVTAGQVIAEMGVVDRRFWGVHFEMRQGGKPVNPLHYLKKG